MSLTGATPSAIAEASRLLREGRLVAFPTETVYGLGADATNANAVAGIFEAKGRPRFNPLIAHVPDIEAARRLARFTPLADLLAAAFWPGPLTLVLAKAPGCLVVDLATAGLETIALRIPANDVARSVLRAAGVPVAAPSANRSGRISPTTAAHVAEELGEACAMILDGGQTGVGLESTVIDATGALAVLLRSGAVTREDVARVTGHAMNSQLDNDSSPSSPGQLASHYAPRARVRLGAGHVAPGEALLAFGANVPPHAGPAMNLSASGDLREAAVNLFVALRTLDATGVPMIAVMPIPAHGLGEAINDRLRRAAAPR
jgi:L-threonylcarbamoyladenylate synthase